MPLIAGGSIDMHNNKVIKPKMKVFAIKLMDIKKKLKKEHILST